MTISQFLQQSIIVSLFTVLNIPVCNAGQDDTNSRFRPANEPRCHDWAVISLGKYEINNNVWGKDRISDYKQCIFSNANTDNSLPGKFGWNWSWPKVNDGVKAYPSVLYGRKPWNNYSTTSKLPRRIDQLRHLLITYQLESQFDGAANLLLESWITKTAQAKPAERTGELAIQLYQKDWPGQAGKFITSVTINAIPFDFYVDEKITAPGDNLTWAYFGFVHKGKIITDASIDIKLFVDYLVRKGYIDRKHYLATVELGNEIDHGKGVTTITHFSVSIE